MQIVKTFTTWDSPGCSLTTGYFTGHIITVARKKIKQKTNLQINWHCGLTVRDEKSVATVLVKTKTAELDRLVNSKIRIELLLYMPRNN